MRDTALTIAILAGGAATRLGKRDKGLEPLSGRPMIEQVVERCHALLRSVDGAQDVSILIVANRHLDVYARHARTVADSVIGFAGPLAGVAAALAACTTPRLLTVPVDCPDPPNDLAVRLAQAMDEYDAQAVVASDGERRQPLFALYRSELAASAAAGAQAHRGVHAWQDSIAAREVDFADRRQQFHNLNTPEEFRAYADAQRSRD